MCAEFKLQQQQFKLMWLHLQVELPQKKKRLWYVIPFNVDTDEIE